MSSLDSRESSSSISTSLLVRVRRQDTLAWQRLSNLYGPVVYSWARRSGLQDSDAADVMQDVFQSLLLNISAFRRELPGDSFRGWLWTITHNRIRDFYRSRNQDGINGRNGRADGTAGSARPRDRFAR